MLFKVAHLQGIKSGKISIAFRKWRKLSIKSGNYLHTAIGLLEIGEIREVDENEITNEDAILAGYSDKSGLLKSFFRNSLGTIYRINVKYHAEDPRIALRNQTQLSKDKLEVLKNKLDRLDQYSRRGPWTKTILLAIRDNPNLHAIGIAKLTGFEKEWLKLNIRKLKNLGLTISHTVGYELSPMGKEYVDAYHAEEKM